MKLPLPTYFLQENEPNLLLNLGVVIFILYLVMFVLFFTKKRNKHYYKIKNGERVLRKLNSFEFNGAKINYLRKIDAFVFEELVLSAFKNKGYKIKRNKRYTGDGGIDGVVYLNGDKLLVQCKRYKSYVNKQDIINFERLIDSQGLSGGFFVHTGKTGKDTYKSFATSKVKLISGDKLIQLITSNENTMAGADWSFPITRH